MRATSSGRVRRPPCRAAAALVACAGAVLAVAGVDAQGVSIGVSGLRTTYDEAVAANRRAGFGAIGLASYESGSWAVEGEVAWRRLSPDADGPESLTMTGSSIRGRYDVWRSLEAEVGFESRTVDPEFSAQELGALTVGLRYESVLTSLASMWVRGAALPVSSFSGGGSGGLGTELGFGVRVARPQGRWRAVAGYRFQRIDREVSGAEVPMELSALRVGFEYAWR